jgi:hypothetical protein
VASPQSQPAQPVFVLDRLQIHFAVRRIRSARTDIRSKRYRQGSIATDGRHAIVERA